MKHGHVLLGLALALSACSRDLSVPAPVLAPEILAFEPTEAFNNDVIYLTAKNLDTTDPAKNTVEFSGGTSYPGDHFDDQGRLGVYVPFNAVEGPLTLVTPVGRSDPFGDFIYRGAGRPVLGTVVAQLNLRHLAPALGLGPTDLYVPSQLANAVLGSSGAVIPLGSPPLSFGNVVGGLLLAGLGTQAAGPVLIDPVAQAVVATGPLSGISSRLMVPGPGGTLPIAFTLGEDGGGAKWLQSFTRAGTSNQLTQQKRQIFLWTATGLLGLPDGRLMVIGRKVISGRQVAGVIVYDLTVSANPAFVPAPQGKTPVGPAVVVPGSSPTKVLLALDDGTILGLTVGATLTWDSAAFATGSASPAESLVVAQPASGPLLLGTFPDEGTVVGYDLTLQTTWTVQLRGRPSALIASATEAYAADDDENGVDVIRLSNQNVVARLPFSAGFDSPSGCVCGGATPPGTGDVGSQIWLLARNLRQVLPIDVDLLEIAGPIPLAASTSNPRGIFTGPDGRMWVMHETELGIVSTTGETVATPSDLPAPPLKLAFPSTEQVLVGSDKGVSLYQRASATAQYTYQGSSNLPDGGHLTFLAATSAGKAMVGWATNENTGVQAHAGLWSLSGLAGGAQPDAHFDATSGELGFLGAMPQSDGALFFFREVAALSENGAPMPGVIWFDANLAAHPARGSPVDSIGPLLMTPDTRYVVWERFSSGDRKARLTSAWPDQPTIFDIGTWNLDGDFGEAVTDQTGEWLFIPLRGRDTVSVVQ